MATSDCSFCTCREGPFVLRRGTAAICDTCVRVLGAELGLATPPPEAATPRERWNRALANARMRAATPEPPGPCSFCGVEGGRVVCGHSQMRGESELVVVLGDAVSICVTCIERAVAAAKPS